jgi:hypothetical protein
LNATAVPTPLDHAGETDHLVGGVLRSLSRSFRNQFSLSPARAFGLGLITFGVWPLWKLSRQFSDYVTLERQQLWHMAEWLRVRRGGDSSQALHDHLQSIRPRTALKILMAACVLLAGVVIWNEMDGGISLSRLIESTYRTHQPWFDDEGPTAIWLVWVLGLSVAYSLHGLRIYLHHRAVARFVGGFNRLLQREGIPTITMPAFGVRPMRGWWVTEIILALIGAFWGIPMSIAGAMQRRYINSSAARLRAQMLERVRSILQQNRPAIAVPNYVIHGRRCGNALCQASLRASALFCSRCGTSADLMSEVA